MAALPGDDALSAPGQSRRAREGRDAAIDRWPGSGGVAEARGRRHHLRAARRSARLGVRRAVRQPRHDQRRAHPPRAGHRLHGRRLRPHHRQGRHLHRRAGAWRLEHDRRPLHRLLHQLAGPLHHRPGPVRPDRRRTRCAPRGRGPARDAALRHQVERPRDDPERGADRRARGVPPASQRPAPAGRDRDPAGRPPARGRRRASSAAGPGQDGRRPDLAGARRRAARQGEGAADHRRRRRPGRRGVGGASGRSPSCSTRRSS